jgi:hypothetical protein
MKSYIVFIAMYFALSLLACQDSKEELKNVNHELAFYRSIGEQIPLETALKWKDFYRDQNSSQGRLSLSNFNISATAVQALLQSVSSLVGVAFHYGIDDAGVTHIIAIPVDESLQLWTEVPGRIYVDSNTGDEISQAVASTWATRYKGDHPGSIWFHFFGEDIFAEINAISYFNTLEISPAINILTLKPQLLLIVWEEDVLPVGRTKDDSGTSFDASYPCPPCGIN